MLIFLLNLASFPRILSVVSGLLILIGIVGLCVRIRDDEVRWPGVFLSLISWIVCYRFAYSLVRPLELPSLYKDLKQQDIKEKAKGSIASVGIFLGFSIAIVAAVIATDEGRKLLRDTISSAWSNPVTIWWMALCFTVPYVVIWSERFLSAFNDGRKSEKSCKPCCCRYIVLICAWICAILMFVCFPFGGFSQLSQVQQTNVANVSALAGFALLLCSAFFMLISVEFYDSASGWREGKCTSSLSSNSSNGTDGNAFRFHLANLASSLYIIGVTLALAGVCLFLCLVNFDFGCIITAIGLGVVVTMLESERWLWNNTGMK